MSYINKRLSDCVAYGFTGGPEWSTNIVLLDNGGELRNAQWKFPRHRYSAEYMNIPVAARDELLAAFHAAKGRLLAFRFKDWNDYTAEDQQLSVNVGTSDPVQLVKRYYLGGTFAERKVSAIVSATVVDGSGNPVAGTLDAINGTFTPSADWVAGVYSWSGEFDVWVRFDSDFNAFVIGSWQAHTANIELVEVKQL